MVLKQWACKGSFYINSHLVYHLVTAHNATDVADLLVETLRELEDAVGKLEKLTIPKAEENKSEGAIP